MVIHTYGRMHPILTLSVFHLADMPRLTALNVFLIGFGTLFLSLAVITATLITIVAMTKKREIMGAYTCFATVNYLSGMSRKLLSCEVFILVVSVLLWVAVALQVGLQEGELRTLM